MIDSETIAFHAKCALARRFFWDYCNLRDPEFYNESKPYLVDLCTTLQEFKESDDKVLVVNLPPRHAKSRTSQLFVEWVLGHDPSERIMTGSYNEQLSTLFSKNVRNSILEVKGDPLVPVFSDVFPNTRIKKGDSAMNIWSLEGSNVVSYLATSPSGTATGIGCTMLILDDLIKNSEEAYNEGKLERDWDWFTNTMFSRKEGDWKVLIVGTRWATGDLSGRALEHFERIGVPVRHITYRALQEDGTMLCPQILSREDYDIIMNTSDKAIVSANYDQIPIDLEGCLYRGFKTYDGALPQFTQIKAYVDVADTGDDFLAAGIYGVTFDKRAYLLDVLYTQDPNEVTEVKLAEMLVKQNVNVADIESNSGGRAFARNVDRIMRERFRSNRCVVRPFHQSKNKDARILSNAPWVMENVMMPFDWSYRWPDFNKDIMRYQRAGKNKHDDAPDMLTGIAEKCDSQPAISF